MVGVDKKRNSVGGTYIFTCKRTSLSNTLLALYDKAQAIPPKEWQISSELIEKLIANVNANVFGFVHPYISGNASNQPPPFGKLDPLRKLTVLGGIFDNPPYIEHLCALLESARDFVPAEILSEEDLIPVFSTKRFGGNSVVQRTLKYNLNKRGGGDYTNLSRFVADTSDYAAYSGSGHQESMTQSQAFGFQSKFDNKDLAKTRVCNYFMQGNCTKGNNCNFSHTLPNSNSIGPNFPESQRRDSYPQQSNNYRSYPENNNYAQNPNNPPSPSYGQPYSFANNQPPRWSNNQAPSIYSLSNRDSNNQVQQGPPKRGFSTPYPDQSGNYRR